MSEDAHEIQVQHAEAILAHVREVAEKTDQLALMVQRTEREKSLLIFAARDAVFNLDRVDLALKLAGITEDVNCSPIRDAITSLRAALLEAGGIDI